mgnify:CR=1 FL=1
MAVRKTQDQYVQELAQENKRIHHMAYALIVLLIAVIVASVLKQFILTSLLLVAAILYQIFVVRRQQRAYLKKCENTNLELSTLKDFSDTDIEEKGTQLSEQDLDAAGLLPFVPKTASFFKSVHGVKEKLDICATDCSVAQHQHEKGVAADINTGNWIRIRLPEHTGLNVRILEDGLFPEAFRTDFYQKQQLEEVARPDGIPSSMHLYTADQEAKLPSGAFLQKLRSFTDYTPGKVAVSIRDDVLDVYIRNRFLSAGFSVREALTKQELIRDPYPELQHVLELVSFLIR